MGSESGNYLKLLNSRHKFNLKIVERVSERVLHAVTSRPFEVDIGNVIPAQVFSHFKAARSKKKEKKNRNNECCV